jgi:hypothetical protein
MVRTGAGSLEQRWTMRDNFAATGLFLATAAVVLWQNAHLAVLWDLSYILDSSVRIALGQAPYRDFPFVHAPLTFLIQAAIIRLTGRVYFHHVLYAATVGGLGTVLAWRIVLHTLRGRLDAAWSASVVLAAPLTVLGIYCILPHPSYDCDCVFSILLASLLLQRLTPDSGYSAAPRPGQAKAPRPGQAKNLFRPVAAGAAIFLPLFFKQNIGLPLLLATLAGILLLLAAEIFRRAPASSLSPGRPVLLAVLAGSVTTLVLAGLLLQSTVGLGNYVHWTIQFAAQRRLPGLKEMLEVYRQPLLLWMLPSVTAGLALLLSRLSKTRWAQALALGLLAAPFLFTLFALLFYDDADERGDSLLGLWPLLLILAAVLTLYNLCRGLSLRALLPAIVLVAIHGTLLSQQLWGSTYAIWPLLILLIAGMIAYLATVKRPDAGPARPQQNLALVLSVVIAATLLICGGLYTVSEERLTYLQLPDGPALPSTYPQLVGMAVSGPYLPNFEELLRFTAANIPQSDGILLIPGEDPFYFVTGRVPQFPLLLFDPATDPYSPAQLVEQARAHNIRWLIVKRELQLNADPTPRREAVLKALLGEFKLDTRLRGYDIYRRP